MTEDRISDDSNKKNAIFETQCASKYWIKNVCICECKDNGDNTVLSTHCLKIIEHSASLQWCSQKFLRGGGNVDVANKDINELLMPIGWGTVKHYIFAAYVFYSIHLPS